MHDGMVRSSTFPLYDRAVGGQLTGLLRQWRAEPDPVSFDVIARSLFIDYGLEVSSSTVRRWCASLDEEAAA